MATLLNHDNYTIAWIAVLPIEAQAALAVLDKQHDGHFPSIRSDDYIYIGNEVNGHNVVVATLPEGQNYGIGAAAALASQLKSRFPHIWFSLLVGVAAGLPDLMTSKPSGERDIRLGDVLVCVPDKESTGVVQYDLGREVCDQRSARQRYQTSSDRQQVAFGLPRRCLSRGETNLQKA